MGRLLCKWGGCCKLLVGWGRRGAGWCAQFPVSSQLLFVKLTRELFIGPAPTKANLGDLGGRFFDPKEVALFMF